MMGFKDVETAGAAVAGLGVSEQWWDLKECIKSWGVMMGKALANNDGI